MKSSRAFTLVELLVYIGIMMALLIVVSTLYLALSRAKLKQQEIANVEAQGQTAMALVTQAIRNAQSVGAPAANTNGTSLTLATSVTATNPTIVSLSSGILYLKEGTTAAVPLTSPQVVVSGLSFQNLSRANSSGSVRIEFTLTHTTSSRTGNYSRPFTGAATLRLIP